MQMDATGRRSTDSGIECGRSESTPRGERMTGMAMSSSEFNQVPLEDRPRAASESQVAVPSLNVFLGSTPSFAALEMMRGLIHLPEGDQRKVALVFLDIDSPPSEVY